MHVVVVAYGPRAITKRAVAKARALGTSTSSITVVPAGPMTTVRPGMFGDAAVSVASGSGAVRTVITALTDDVVLLTHDDVDIDASAATALRSALSHQRYAVPKLSSVHRPGLSCVAARASDIAALPGSLVLPGAALDAAPADVAQVDTAIHHRDRCRHRLVPDRRDPAHPLLVASMIVRDEQEALPGALASISGLVDRIDVCDTGSVDATIEVVHASGGNVREIAWRDDFAWARNQALAMCTDSVFVIMFDADERIEVADPARIRRWLRTWAHEIDGVVVRVDNDRGSHEVATSVMSPRIARPSSRFDGAIHEVLTIATIDGRPEGRVVVHPDMTVHHIGYRADVVAERGKVERNVAIARSVHEQAPCLKSTVDLARALLAADPTSDEAIALYDEAAALLGPEDKPSAHSMVLAAQAQHKLASGDAEAAVALARDALSYTPSEGVALLSAAQGLVELDRVEDLVALHEALVDRPPGEPLFVVPRNVARYHAVVADALLRVGRIDAGIELLARVMVEDAAGVGDLAAAAVANAIDAGVDPSALLPLLADDTTGQVIDAIARSVAPAITASLCVGALGRGATAPTLAVMAITAALVAANDQLVDAAVAHADLLDPPTRAKLADLAVRKNRRQTAERISHHNTSPYAAIGGRP